MSNKKTTDVKLTNIEYKKVTVQCSCGNSFETQAAIKGTLLKIDICSKCHPFFNKSGKALDAEGKIESFKKKFGDLESLDL